MQMEAFTQSGFSQSAKKDGTVNYHLFMNVQSILLFTVLSF